jgi:hypothetical protein
MKRLLLVVLLNLMVDRMVRVVDNVWRTCADVHVDQAAAAALDGAERVD